MFLLFLPLLYLKNYIMKSKKSILILSILSVLFFASCESKSIIEEDQEYESLQRGLDYTVGEDGVKESDEDAEWN